MTTTLPPISTRAAALFDELATKDDVRAIVREELAPVRQDLDAVKANMARLEQATLSLIDAFNANSRSIEAGLRAKGIDVALKPASRP